MKSFITCSAKEANYSAPTPIFIAHSSISLLAPAKGRWSDCSKELAGDVLLYMVVCVGGCPLGTGKACASHCGPCFKLWFHFRTNQAWPPACPLLAMGSVWASSASDFIHSLNVSQSLGKSSMSVFIRVLIKAPLFFSTGMHILTRQL